MKQEGIEYDRAGRIPESAAHAPRTDLLSGGALFLFALIYGFGARGLVDSGDPGVALVPIGLAAALALLSGGIALSGWRRLRRARDSDTAVDPGPSEAAAPGDRGGQPDRDTDAAVGAGDDRPGLIRGPGPARAWTVIGLTLLYAALFQTLGYVLATLVYTGAVAERFGARRRTILVLAPCVTLLTFLLFRVILGARLPAGVLG